MHTPQQTTLIGLCGPAGSGKDAVRSILENRHDFVGLAYADPLRAMVHALLTATGSSTDYLLKRELKETPVPGLGVSTRHMMQAFGTDCARHQFGEDFWVNAAAATVASLRLQGYRQIVVSDVRFANEAAWIRSQGGEVWLIERPGLAPVRRHASECINFRVDQVLRNDSTLDALAGRVLGALVSQRIFARPPLPVGAPAGVPVVAHVAADDTEGGAV